jgi:site-specific recombinase XerD
VDISELSAPDVQLIFMDCVKGLGKRSRQLMTTTVESLIRYLRSVGHVSSTCVPFIPRLKSYAMASLPSVIAEADVERTIAGIDTSDPLGRRNYALLVLVATYGLRSSEVVGLRLEDLDWRQEVLAVCQTKTRRELKLPMTSRVRDALIDYLCHGRPETTDRYVFQKVHAPRGPITRVILYCVVRSALLTAGIKAPQYGSNILRHSRATSLIRDGHSLKVVGDLFGHRVPEATLIYLKHAIEDLREVALELPEVR